MKNDITYEYRVFTNRLIDVESMEVGKCTSKVIKELKQKDKVDGRFFHTSDTDEWFFCWNGKLQKLNLKGNSDVNAALAEVRELIKKAETSVDNVNKISQEAITAANSATTAANEAKEAVKSIENKADKSYVDGELENKADKSALDDYALKSELNGLATESYVDQEISKIQNSSYDDTEIKNQLAKKADKSELFSKSYNDLTDKPTIPSIEGLASEDYVNQEISKIQNTSYDDTEIKNQLENKADKSELFSKSYNDLTDKPTIPSIEGLATKTYVDTEIEKLNIDSLATKEELKSCATKDDLNAYAKTSDIPENIVVKDDLNAYATTEYVDEKIGKLEIPEGVDLSGLVNQIEGKQDVIDDLEEIRDNAKNALKSVPDEYVKETELASKGYLTDQSLDNYYTKTEVYTQAEIDAKIQAINDLIGNATEYIKDTILA